MTAHFEYSPIEGSVIQAIILVDRVLRPEASRFESVSAPGHLLHLIIDGEVEQVADGRTQHFGPGMSVWYHENETVSGRIVRAPWTFFTVNFRAPRLPPPPYEARVRPAEPSSFTLFEALLAAWHGEDRPLSRHLRSFALLQSLLLEVLPIDSQRNRSDRASQLWWEIEAKVREDLSQPIDTKWLQAIGGYSERSIARACELATGVAPMKRIKELRLSYARGLVHYSQRSMTEIALDVGYQRVQELSRDYRHRFGLTPRQDRQAELEYKKQHIPPS